MTEQTNDYPITANLKLLATRNNNHSVKIKLVSDTQLFYAATKTFYYRMRRYMFGQWTDESIKTTSLTIFGGQTESKEVIICADLDHGTVSNYNLQIGLTENDMANGLNMDIIETIKEDTQIYPLGNNNFIESQKQATNNIKITGNLIPSVLENRLTEYSLGNSQAKWLSIYAISGSIDQLNTAAQTIDDSDRNKKNTIEPISANYEAIFDTLRPVTFKYNNGESDRLHTGFIAQEVKEATENAGLTTKDFAAYCEWEDSNGEMTCGLRYGEFIALCVDQIQKLKLCVVEQDKVISDLTSRLEALEEKMK